MASEKLTNLQKSSEIGIAIPTYRSAEVLTWVVDSILRQSFADFTLYILDNGAPQRFYEVRDVIRKINDNRIRYQANTQNIGHLKNYEQCFHLVSSHRFGMVIPSDMALTLDCLEKLRQAANQYNADIVFPATEATSDLDYAIRLTSGASDDGRISTGADCELVCASQIVPEFFGPLNRGGEYGRFGVFGSLSRGKLFVPISKPQSVFAFHGWEYQKSMTLAAGARKIALLSDTLFVLLTDHQRSPSTARPATDWTRLEPLLATYETAVLLLRDGFTFANEAGFKEIILAHDKLLEWYFEAYGDHQLIAKIMKKILDHQISNPFFLRCVFSLLVRFRKRKLTPA